MGLRNRVLKILQSTKEQERADLVIDSISLGVATSNPGYVSIKTATADQAGDAITTPYLAVGSQSDSTGYGGAIGSSLTSSAGFYADDGGANCATSCRNVRARTLLTTDQSGGSIRSLQGQLKMATGVDVGTGIYTAVQGYVEMAGTHSANSAATFSCIDASAEITTALTVASGGEFFGVHVETTGAGTITNNGTCAAIGITKATGAASWPVGLYVSSATTGVSIAAATTSISIAGAFTTGISIAADGTTGITITNAFTGTTGISMAGTASDGLIISGACTDAIEISGDATNAINISSGCTPTVGVLIAGAAATPISITGAFTTGISVAADGTTGVAVTNAFSGTTMLSLAGTATDGINISGICADGIEISAAATTTGINISADCVTGITIGAQTTAGITIGATATGISITGATGYALDIQTSGQLRMGIQGTGIPTASATPFAVEIHAENAADITAGSTGLTCGIRCRYEVAADQTSQISYEAIDARLRPKKDLADGNHCGINGTIEASESGTVMSGSATTVRSGGFFSLDFDANVSITSGYLCGVTIDSSVNGSVSMASCSFNGIYIKTSGSSELWEYGLYMETGDVVDGIYLGATTQACEMVVSALPANARGARFAFTCATPAMDDGYGAHEIDLTIGGIGTGSVSATSTWINAGASATLAAGAYTWIHNDGVWLDNGATATSNVIAWSRVQFAFGTNTTWANLHLFDLNLDIDANMTSLINVNNLALTGFTAGAHSSAVTGSLPFIGTGGTVKYIRLYDSAS